MKLIEEFRGKGDFNMSNSTLIMLMIIVVILALISIFCVGCLSASSMTGSATESKLKAEQQSSQETTSTDRVKLEIQSTVITTPDGTIIKVGGGFAETGSKMIQSSDVLNEISAKVNAQTEASSKSSFNITAIIIGLGIFVILLVVFELYRIKKGIF